MDSKMNTLINKLAISDKLKSELESAKLDKIVANTVNTDYCFYIKLNINLSVEIYNELI